MLALNRTSRIKNSKKNVSYGIIVTVLGTVVSFANRTVFVKCLGAEYLGLNGLFNEVIAMLSLAELGIGMAINYSLYKPIHENDFKKISQLMSLFKRTYNLVALSIFVIGLILLPFVHLVVNGTDFSLSYIRWVFFLFLLNTSSSYLFSYNTSFITAVQKQYVFSLSSSIINVVFSIIKVALLVLYQNYILTILLMIFQTLINNVYITLYVRKKYPFIDYKEKLPKEERQKIFKDIKNIFIKRISGVITSSTTNVLISTLVSTVQVGFYSNYTIFFGITRTLNRQFSNGVKAGIGDLTAAEDSEKCILILRRLTFMFFLFSFFACTLLISIISDIIEIWLGSEFVMANLIVYAAIFNLYIEICSEPLWQFLEVSGLFRQDRNIAIIGSLANLIVAISLGYAYGIVGIFCGTMCTQLIQLFLKSKLIYDKMFVHPVYGYWFMWLRLLTIFLLTVCLIDYTNVFFDYDFVVLNILAKTIVTFSMSLAVVFICFRKCPEYQYSVDFAKEIVLNKKTQ